MLYRIRELQEKDLEGLVQTFCFPWSSVEATRKKWKQYFEEHQRRIRTVYLLEEQGDVIGYASLLRESHYPDFRKNGIPEINDVWIAPEHRRKWLGRKLIQHVENVVYREQHSRIGIGVGLYSDYGRAQKLYARLGYVPDGQGVTYKGQYVVPGDSYPIDDDLLLWLVKNLS